LYRHIIAGFVRQKIREKVKGQTAMPCLGFPAFVQKSEREVGNGYEGFAVA
jgi:hypothetical protein